MFENRDRFNTVDQFTFVNYMADTSEDLSDLLGITHHKLQSLMEQITSQQNQNGNFESTSNPTGTRQEVAQSLLHKLEGERDENMQHACSEWAGSVENLHAKAVAWQDALATLQRETWAMGWSYERVFMFQF